MGSDDLSRKSASALVVHALRLGPGVDLRLELERSTRTLGLRAACVVSCVGSLARACLRLAGADGERVLGGPLEIVSLVGTLSPDGPHLHVALSDAQGCTFGGHLLAGSIVATTAELVLGELTGTSFRRVLDPQTGFRELEVRASDRSARV